MPDTLMLAFQRPSDEVIEVLRHCAQGNPVRLKDVRKWGDAFTTAIRLGLVVREYGPLEEFIYPASDLGRLVLAACDTDTPDPVGKVVEADRIAVYLTRGEISLAYSLAVQNENMWDACSDDPIPDTATSLVQALARATGKVGEVG